MSREHEDEALSIIKEINRNNNELSHALTQQDHYDDSHNVFWVDEEFSLRKEIKRLERELNILNSK